MATTKKIEARAMNWGQWSNYQDFVGAQQALVEENKLNGRRMACNLQEWVIKNVYEIDLNDPKQTLKTNEVIALCDKTMELTLKKEDDEVKN